MILPVLVAWREGMRSRGASPQRLDLATCTMVPRDGFQPERAVAVSNATLERAMSGTGSIENFSDPELALSGLQIEMDRAQSQVTSAQGEVDRLVGQLKAARDKSSDTLEDWQKAFAGGNVYYPTGQEAS